MLLCGRMEVKCDYCGKVKDRKPSDLKGKKNHFCSMDCFSKWLKATGARKGKNNPKYGTTHSEQTLEKIRTNVKKTLAREDVREKLKGKKKNTAGYKKGSDFPLLNDKEWLNNKYWTEEKDIDEIAEIVGCNRVTVWNALKRLGIERREQYRFPKGNNNRKGSTLTDAEKEQRRRTSQELWQNPEYRENVCSQLPRGEENHKWKGGPVEVKCENCGKIIERDRFRLEYAKHQFCSPECHFEWMKGENAPSWQGGISFGRYCPKFNEAIKEEIREKYGRQCFLCGKTEKENGRKLDVHHIDYEKSRGCSGKRWLLIPLCKSCHAKTGHNREYWENLILTKMRKRKLSNGQTIIDAFATLI